MALLQPKLNLKVSQKQILTPGLVQMVSVLALNKLELADMINAELTENPVLEELDNSVPLLDEVSAREEKFQQRRALTTSCRRSVQGPVSRAQRLNHVLLPRIATKSTLTESQYLRQKRVT